MLLVAAQLLLCPFYLLIYVQDHIFLTLQNLVTNPKPDSIHRATVNSRNLSNSCVIGYPLDDDYCKIKTYTGVNTD
jgi:hypothetical protein